MEETIVQNLQNTLPAIATLIQKEDNMVINYDKQADVLYISFGNPQKADDTEIFKDNFLVRKKGQKIVGITVLNFRKSSLVQ